MPVIYHWRGDIYRDNLIARGVAETLVLQQDSPAFQAMERGERLWAFTRRSDGTYVLAAQYVVRRVVPASRAVYGHFEAVPEPGTTVWYDTGLGEDVSSVIRALSIRAESDPLGRSFQGNNAVRRISAEDDRLLSEFADRQRKLPLDAHAPLVLTVNERTMGGEYDYWKDVIGEQYHFPQKYRRLVRSDRPFVYYRGTRRADGGRGTPEYFGCGRIGSIWRDPEDEAARVVDQRWYCAIEDYVPFKAPVEWTVAGERLERIPANMFRDGVRELPQDTYRRILDLAGISTDHGKKEGHTGDLLADFSDVSPEVVESVMVSVPRKGKGAFGGRRGGGGGGYSTQSKVLGDRAEEVVYEILAKRQAAGEIEALSHPAKASEYVGYDIEYQVDGRVVGVEVKGTTAERFSGVQVTANEWERAREMREDYHLYLVAKCSSARPRIQIIENPASLEERGELAVSTQVWLLQLASSSW